MVTTTRPSPFLQPGSTSTASSLAVLHLRRDQLLPTILQDKVAHDTGYAEGAVANTRFGSYPHSTLIGLPWGSQILASKVDTGTRGRKGQQAKNQKRKADAGTAEDESNKKQRLEDTEQDNASTPMADSDLPTPSPAKQQKSAITAASGFCHILPPTPESWTISLPHRTQIVYTPDYSFVLQKLRVRPGSVVIEAGAGSGSFTHAAARAVFNGYPPTEPTSNGAATTRKQHGRVCSFEYHAPRAAQLDAEIATHGLASVVTVTHRDVYADGFLLPNTTSPTALQTSPKATAVFLDLPAPWLALPHLSRHPASGAPSPFSPHVAIHLTCFLPCIEQTQRAITALRTLGWVDVCMYALAQRRVDVRRERTGLDLEGLRGVNVAAKSVEEALERLREVDGRARGGVRGEDGEEGGTPGDGGDGVAGYEKKQDRLARLKREADGKKVWLEGRLVCRTEPEIKTHTSYLVFAVLPREWSSEDEEEAARKWVVKPKVVGEKEKKAEV